MSTPKIVNDVFLRICCAIVSSPKEMVYYDVDSIIPQALEYRISQRFENKYSKE
jgi:hypothetical protein